MTQYKQNDNKVDTKKLGELMNDQVLDGLKKLIKNSKEAKRLHDFLMHPEEILPERDPVREHYEQIMAKLTSLASMLGCTGTGGYIAAQKLMKKLPKLSTQFGKQFFKVAGWGLVAVNVFVIVFMVNKVQKGYESIKKANNIESRNVRNELQSIKNRVIRILEKCNRYEYNKIKTSELESINDSITKQLRYVGIIIRQLEEQSKDLKKYGKLSVGFGVAGMITGGVLLASGIGGPLLVGSILVSSVCVTSLGALAWWQSSECMKEAQQFYKITKKLQDLQRIINEVKKNKAAYKKDDDTDDESGLKGSDVRKWEYKDVKKYFDTLPLSNLNCYNDIIEQLNDLDLMNGCMLLDVRKEDFMDDFECTGKIKKIHRRKVWTTIQEFQDNVL